MLWLALFTGVLANTESCLVEYNGPKQAGLNPNQEIRAAAGLETWSAAIGEPGKYFAKVCWPASQPADLQVQFNGTHLLVNANPLHNDPIEFTVLLSTFQWGIPKDVLGVIPFIILALCTGYLLL